MEAPKGLVLPPTLGPFNCEKPAGFQPVFLVAWLNYSGSQRTAEMLRIPSRLILS